MTKHFNSNAIVVVTNRITHWFRVSVHGYSEKYEKNCIFIENFYENTCNTILPI